MSVFISIIHSASCHMASLFSTPQEITTCASCRISWVAMPAAPSLCWQERLGTENFKSSNAKVHPSQPSQPLWSYEVIFFFGTPFPGPDALLDFPHRQRNCFLRWKLFVWERTTRKYLKIKFILTEVLQHAPMKPAPQHITGNFQHHDVQKTMFRKLDKHKIRHLQPCKYSQ